MKEDPEPVYPSVGVPPTWAFYYGMLTSFYVYYAVPLDALLPHLKHTRLDPMRFRGGAADGMGAVALNLQFYCANNGDQTAGPALERTNEVEFDIISYPKARRDSVGEMSLAEYLGGADQAKVVGNYRLYVPCDDPVAIQYGIETFGERKFRTTFSYKIPSPNLPGQSAWHLVCDDPLLPDKAIFTLDAELPSSTPTVGNISSIVQYSYLPGGLENPPGPDSRLGCSRWDVYGLFRSWCPLTPLDQDKVKLELGESGFEMRKAMSELLGDCPRAIALQAYQSGPVAAEGRPFYADI